MIVRETLNLVIELQRGDGAAGAGLSVMVGSTCILIVMPSVEFASSFELTSSMYK